MCEEALHNFAGLEGIPQKKWFNAVADVTMSGKMLVCHARDLSVLFHQVSLILSIFDKLLCHFVPQVLSKLLPSFLERGDKILLFSYSTKILDLVQKYLLKMRYVFIEGVLNSSKAPFCNSAFRIRIHKVNTGIGF